MGEESKKIHALLASNVRGLIEMLNINHIKKDNIISIINKPEGIFVIYEQ